MTAGTMVGAPAPVRTLAPSQCDRTPDDVTRQKQQKAAWDAYYGKFRDSVDSEPGKRNRNVKSNRCAAIVDKVAAWLAGPGLEIEVTDKDAPPLKKAKKAKPGAAVKKDDRQAFIDDFLGDADKFKAFQTMVYMMGAATGHAFIKLVYDETKPKAKPRYTLLDSQHVWVLVDPDDCNIPLVYCIEYETPISFVSAGGRPQTLVKRQIIARVAQDGTARYGQMNPDGALPDGAGELDDDTDTWTITTYIRLTQSAPGAGGSWKQIGDVIVWDFVKPPIVDCMNLPCPDQYVGLPNLSPELIALNEKLNDVQSDTATTLEAYSNPIPYSTGFSSVEMVKIKPGYLLELPDGTTAGVLQPRGDIASNRDFANDLRADMDERSRVPAVALGRQESLPKGSISGIALTLMFQPLMELVKLQRCLYGPLWQALCMLAMVAANVADEDTTEVRLHWGEMLPADDAAAAQLALAMSQVGTSKHAVDAVLHLDYDEEQEYLKEESAEELGAFAKGQGLPPTADPLQQPAVTPEGAPASPQDATAQPTQPAPVHPAMLAAQQAMQSLKK